MTRKGDHIPKEDKRRRNRVEGTPHNQAREEVPRLKEQHRPWRRAVAVRTNASRSPQRQPEAEKSHED